MARRFIIPNCENCTLEELDAAAACTPHRKNHNRMMAIHALMLGVGLHQVCLLYHIAPRTLRQWVRDFNERGIDGLIAGKSPGAPRKIAPEQSHQYRSLVENPAQAGQVHWTARKFHGYLRQTLGHEVGYSTLVRWLHEENFVLKVPRPWPDRQDEAQRRDFLALLRELIRDPDVDVWYLDESGFEGDPRPRRRWAQKGDTPRVTRNNQHLRMSVTGMVCPRTGQFYALEFTHSDSVVLQTFLEHANADVRLERPRNIVICDNASWHKNKKTDWGRFEVRYLPPYSPDLNPIERLWLLLKAEWFADFIAQNRDELLARLDLALQWLIARDQENQRTCCVQLPT